MNKIIDPMRWEFHYHRFPNKLFAWQPFIFCPAEVEGCRHVAFLEWGGTSYQRALNQLPPQEEVIRRGTLMAASPQMLTALQKAEVVLTRAIDDGWEDASTGEVGHALFAVKAAIAAATVPEGASPIRHGMPSRG